ncbi:alpha-galactosidase [Bacteroides sp.]
MKKLFTLFIALLAIMQMNAQEKKIIRISTDKTDLILQVAPNGRLYQSYLGDRLLNEKDMQNLPYYVHAGSDGSVTPRGWEVYAGSGAEDYFEPAIAITHNDGNPSTILRYVSSEQKAVKGGTETTVLLKDDRYPVEVTLHYIAYPKENVIKTWSETKHNEKKPVTLWRYASTMLYFSDASYYLTEFSSDWAKEAQMSTQQLQFGKKVIDTKLGSRAAMHTHPFFELGLNQPAQEHQGQVMLGTLGWTGNFQFTFEIDNVGNLRVIPAINPYASNYELKPGEVFTTPEFIFTLSNNGTGEASRNLHAWARNHQLKDGQGDRLTLLNNWENTGFNFNQDILAELMKEAKHLGVDMFLLDDGWFGNKHPRNDDHAGLGDWEVMHSKLPGGIPALVDAAKTAGVKFGIWIEPEMVNPRSDLFEAHPDWAIMLPNRETYYYRNQLVLDLSNPKVQDYVFGVVDKIMTENPDVAFFKWDCNSPITNIYSPYLKDKQGQLYIDHVRGVYNVMKRVKEKFPNVPMMLCSGGGARCDYEALKYFTEFWCSDNTDPIERLFIQWGFSQIFPAKAMCAHVTSWNKNTSVKFRTDVASMCKLGFDLGLKELSADELTYCQDAVSNFKRLKKVILDGDLYRLVSPYDSNHMSVMYAAPDASKAVLYAYDIHPRFGEKLLPVKLQGLNPAKMYRVEEINLMPGAKSTLAANGKTFSGDYLMKVGLDVFTANQTSSRVIELTAE